MTDELKQLRALFQGSLNDCQILVPEYRDIEYHMRVIMDNELKWVDATQGNEPFKLRVSAITAIWIWENDEIIEDSDG